MTARRTWLALTLFAVTATLIAIGVAAAIATLGRGSHVGGAWILISFVVPVAAFSVVGGLIALRQPGNRIGWLLSTIGLLFAIVIAASAVSAWAIKTHSLSKATGEWISVPASAWVFGLGLIGTQLPLRLPDGELPSSRWKWYSRVTVALIAVSFVGMVAAPGRVDNIHGTANPVHLPWAEPLAAVFLLVIASFVVGVVALIGRYRRAGAHDRAKLRWIAFGGVAFLAIYLVTLPNGGDNNAITFISQMDFAALPAAIGYAILRHRLYDIDVVIHRTVVYGALTATLAATYLASVLLLQLALGGLTSDSNLAIAGSTLAVAALFRPARNRIQELVDRRFYRRRYDAQRTLESFGSRLRDEVALDSLSAELRGVVSETIQPAHVSLWLRGTEVGHE